jgi:carboxypeptidase PM20D1
MMNVQFSTVSGGGHASAPPTETPVDLLAKACRKLHSHPFRMHLTKPAVEMFDTLGRYSSFPYKIIFANLWCFAPILDLICRRSGGELNALLRTTVAFTQMSGSSGRNVIPAEAKMVANIRLNPADTVERGTFYINKTIHDSRVKVTVLESFQPSPISRTNCPAWEKMVSAVSGTWRNCVVAPYLMVQCADARHYRDLSRHVYRFSAMDMTAEERKTIHGNNERIRLEAITKAVEFYIRLMGQC